MLKIFHRWGKGSGDLNNAQQEEVGISQYQRGYFVTEKDIILLPDIPLTLRPWTTTLYLPGLSDV